MTTPLGTLDLNSLPVWLVAIVITLTLLPRAVQGMGAFIPPLGAYLAGQQERQDAIVHARLNSDAAAQLHEVRITDRMLTILEDSLKKTWEDRELSRERMNQVEREIAALRQVITRTGDILSVHTASVSKLADEVEGTRTGMAGLVERINSMGAWAMEFNKQR